MSSVSEIKSMQHISEIAIELGMNPRHRQGKSTASCPYCGDKSGHLYLYDISNRFYCFKCHKAGDWIDLWQHVKNQSPQTAINEIKQRYGHPNTIQPNKPHKSALVKPLNANPKPQAQLSAQRLTEIYLTLHNLAGLTQAGREYLRKRGISERLAERFDISSMDDPRSIGKQMQDLFHLDELIDAGLYNYSSKGKPFFVFFQPCLLFFHFNAETTAITSISTRNLAGDVKCFKLSNRPSTPFYGDITDGSRLHVFEGIITALSYAELTGNCCFAALCGTITPKQYQDLISSHPNHSVILGMDPDEAGHKALSAIQKCEYVNWTALASQLGHKGLQYHQNGKAWDLNDYLVNHKSKDARK